MIPLKDILQGADSLIDNLTTTDEERMAGELEFQKLSHQENMGQLEINKVEAAHKSIFVAGWRPFIGWVCGAGVLYQFFLYGFLLWFWSIAQGKGWIDTSVTAPPSLDVSQLMTLILGMLGLGGLRSYDKQRGTSTESITGTKKESRILKRLNRVRSK